MRIWICLFPFLLLPLLLNSMVDHAAKCDALLQFSNSFAISQDASRDYCDRHSYPKTASWKNGTDCCSWDGVACHQATNLVTGLDVSCSWLLGPLHSSSTLFSLTGLQNLNLAGNDFNGSQISPSLIGMKNEETGGLQYMGNPKYMDFYQDSIVVEMKGLEIELVKILTVFTSIDFSSNFFEGEIPEVIGDLKALKGLNFSHNNLSGIIPASVGNLANLEWLDFSSNKLNGTIPRGLAAITWLSVLNLSNNQLTGLIPQSTQFGIFSHSFEGNPGLCGHPLPKLCKNDTGETPPSTSHEEEETESGNWIEWRAVPMGYGCGLVLGISIGYIVLETGRPRWLARMIERKRSRKTRRQNKNICPGNHCRRSTGGH